MKLTKQKHPHDTPGEKKRILLPVQEKQEMWVQYLGQEDPLKEEMETHSSITPWKIQQTEESGELQSMGVAKSLTWLITSF